MSGLSGLAQLLQAYGPWGLLAVTLTAIVYLFRQLQDAHKRELAMAERILPKVAVDQYAEPALPSRAGLVSYRVVLNDTKSAELHERPTR